MVKKFMSYAIPSAIGMLITSLYMVVDGIFVAQGVGEIGVAAVTIVFPLTTAFVCFSLIFGVGAANLISINFGKGDKVQANNIFKQSVYSLLVIGLILCFLGLLLSDKIVTILGASNEIKPVALEYFNYYILFSIPSLLAMALSILIRNDGSSNLSMISMVLGALTNIILDYIFIFPFGMGLKGAAIATGLGQSVSVLVCMLHFLKKKSNLSLGKVKFNIVDFKEIFRIGFPSFFVEICYSIVMYFMNIAIIDSLGSLGVTAYGVVNYLTNLSYMMLLGIGQAVQPLISYHYGTEEFNKCKGYFKIAFITSLIVSLSLVLISIPFGYSFISIFTSSPDIAKLSYKILMYSNVAFVGVGLNIVIITYYQSICLPKYGNVLCLLRGIILIKLFLIILPPLIGDTGIWISMICSEGITVLASIIFTKRSNETFISSFN